MKSSEEIKNEVRDKEGADTKKKSIVLGPALSPESSSRCAPSDGRIRPILSVPPRGIDAFSELSVLTEFIERNAGYPYLMPTTFSDPTHFPLSYFPITASYRQSYSWPYPSIHQGMMPPSEMPYFPPMASFPRMYPMRPIIGIPIDQGLDPQQFPLSPISGATSTKSHEIQHNKKPADIAETKKEEIKKENNTILADEEKEKGEVKAGGNTYKHRNVYKSIVRHMFSCIRKNRNEVVAILQAAGFNMQDVEHAFYEIGCYNDMERQKGKKKVSQSLVKRIATDKSIYTHILRETLNAMLKNWGAEKFGRLTVKNVTTYRDVCTKYYEETVRVLGQPAQGASLIL